MEKQAESNLKWLAKLTREYRKEFDRELAPLRLNASNYYFILKIRENNQLAQEKLIALTGLSGSNVTRTTQKLIDLGFVMREKNEHDRRGFLLELTAKGNDVYQQIIKNVKRAQTNFLSLLSSAEQKTFENLLDKLSQVE